jgi:DNA-binding transcriptional LysR family regulator
MVMHPDMDSLALFVKAAELRNLTRAAEACFITVPAASRRLSLLEHQFKAQLFERHSRGLELTPAGEQLLTHAREVIAKVTLMRAEMNNYASGSHAVIRLLGNTSAMAQFLPHDVSMFQREHLDCRIVIEESWSDEVVRRLRAGEVDVGVVIRTHPLENLHCLPYRSDRLAAVVRDDDALRADKVSFSELIDRDFVALEGGSSLTRLLTASGEQSFNPVTIRVQVRSFEAVCRAVQSGFGVGVLPINAAQGFAIAMGLRVIPLTDEWAAREMIICVRNRPQPDSPLGQLVSHLHSFALAMT